jgi:hypothetical protein
MSDFFQHGLISTLHRLVDGPILDRHEPLPALESVVLVLPCHYGEIGTVALQGIVKALDEAKFVTRAVISMNGIPDHLTEDVKRFWSRLRKPHVVLWNDSPTLFQQLVNKGLQFDSGKGLNLWLAFGWLAEHQSSGTVLVHDCDIANYDLDLSLALALPVAQLGYSFAKATTAGSEKSYSVASRGSSLFRWSGPWFESWDICLCSTLSTVFVIRSPANIR